MMFTYKHAQDWLDYLSSNRGVGSTTRAVAGADVPGGVLLCADRRDVERVSADMSQGRPVRFSGRPPVGLHGPVVVDVRVFVELLHAYIKLHDVSAETLRLRDEIAYQLQQSEAHVSLLRTDLLEMQRRVVAMQQQLDRAKVDTHI